jgi:hypothetical protein
MTGVPKIVYDRLRAARPERALPGRALPERTGPELAHPDANLLTAFAEQALSAAERDGVLEHLALCGDCREAIALALPAADIVATPVAAASEAVRATKITTKAESNWLTAFSRPGLRWAALAAGVAVVAAVLLVRPGKLNQAPPPPVNQQVATAAQPVPGPQIAPSPIPSSPTGQSAVLTKSDEARQKAELQLSRKLKAGQIVTPSHQAEPGILIAGNKKDSAQADNLSAAPATGARAFAYDASTSRRTTEAVEASGAAPAVALAPSAEGNLMARNETPAIEKAKPALQGIEANEQQKTETAAAPGSATSQARNVTFAAKLASPASQVLAHNVTWTITAGVLQRSLDSGQSWQNALRADRPLLCYARHDQDVWAGGQAGTLFHSADGGVTWAQVRPSIRAQQLGSDVTHIDVRGDARGPAQIVVSAGNNEIWSSADGGKTWEKK